MHLKKFTEKVCVSFRSIRTKMILYYLTFMIVPLCFVMVFVFNVTVNIMKDEILTYVQQTLDQANKNVDKVVDGIMNNTARVCLDPSVEEILSKDTHISYEEELGNEEAMKEIINSYMYDTPNIESFYVMGYNGKIYQMAGNKSSLKRDYTFTSTSWFKKMKKLRLNSLLMPTHRQTDILSEGVPKNVITYISEIRSAVAGDVIGYAMVNVEKSIFDMQLGQIQLERDSNLIIIDNNKTIIFHNEPEQISTQFRASYMSDIFRKSKGNLVAQENGMEMIVAFSTSQTTGWTLINTVPTDILYTKINSLIYTLVYILTISIPVAILMAIFVSNNFSQSISSLRDRMKLVEKGEFDTKIFVKRKDEIGELSESFNSMLERINQLIQKVYRTEISQKAAELDALQAQINPHFLYNTLQVMDIMAEEKEAYEISEACQALSRIFRYSVRKVEEVSLIEEIEHVENYVYIQKLRFGDRLDVEYHIQPETKHLEIIKLIVQPLVENAIVHGTENSTKKCKVTISTTLYQDVLTIIVDDTGIGMDREEVVRVEAEINAKEKPLTVKKVYGGIALRNVNQRIKLRYGEAYGLYLKSKKYRGTRVILTLPAKKYED